VKKAKLVFVRGIENLMV